MGWGAWFPNGGAQVGRVAGTGMVGVFHPPCSQSNRCTRECLLDQSETLECIGPHVSRRQPGYPDERPVQCYNWPYESRPGSGRVSAGVRVIKGVGLVGVMEAWGV